MKIAEMMNYAGFDAKSLEMDLSSRESILKLIDKALRYGEIKMLINQEEPFFTFCYADD